MINCCHLCRGSVKRPMWATRALEISASLSVCDNYLYLLVSLFCSRCLFGGRTFTLISSFQTRISFFIKMWTYQFESLQWDPTQVHRTSFCDVDKACLQHSNRTQHVYPPATHKHTPTKRSHPTTGSISLMLFVFFICFYGSNYPSKDTAKWIRWQGSQFCAHHHTKQWSQVHYWITPTFPHLHFTCRPSRCNKGLQAPR